MHKVEVISFLLGLLVPTGRIFLYLVLAGAKLTGQEVLRDYIHKHFLKRVL